MNEITALQEDGFSLDRTCKDYDLLGRLHKQENITEDQERHYRAGWEAAVEYYRDLLIPPEPEPKFPAGARVYWTDPIFGGSDEDNCSKWCEVQSYSGFTYFLLGDDGGEVEAFEHELSLEGPCGTST